MRKILSGFLATAMVASVCATASFAATATNATISYTPVDPTNVKEIYKAVQFVRINGKEEDVIGEAKCPWKAWIAFGLTTLISTESTMTLL